MSALLSRLALLAAWAFALPLLAGGPQTAPSSGTARIDLHGDPLPEEAVARLGSARLRHETLGRKEFVFSPDGRMLLSHNNYTLHLWDCRTGKRLLELSRTPDSFIAHLAFSPGGQHFLVGQFVLKDNKNSYNVAHYDVKTGQRQRAWDAEQGSGSAGLAAFAGDGSAAATLTRDGAAELRDAATGKVRRRLKVPSPVHDVRLSRDGRVLLTWHSGRVMRWATATGRQLSDQPLPHVVLLRHVAETADLTLFALHVSSAGGVTFWDPATGAIRGKLEDPKLVMESSMAFTPDGKTLVTVDSKDRPGQADFWDVASGRRLRSIPVLTRLSQPPVFAPDGKTVVFPTSASAFSFWDAAGGKERLRSPGHADGLDAFAFTPDGKIAITGSRDDVRAWDAGTGRQLHAFTGRWSRPLVAVLGRRTLLVTGMPDNHLRQYDLQTGKLFRTVPLLTPPGAHISHVKPSADGKTVLVIRWTGGAQSLHVHDLATGRERESRLLGPGDPVNALFAGGNWLAGTREDFAVEMFQFGNPRWLAVKDWKRRRTLLKARLSGPATSFAESHDGRVIATTSFTVAHTPDSNRINESAWQLWEMASGKVRLEVRRERGPEDTSSMPYFSNVALSRDGRTVATAWERTLELWDAVTGQRLLRRTADATVAHLAFTPDGRTLATALNDGTALLWDVRAVVERPLRVKRVTAEEAAQNP